MRYAVDGMWPRQIKRCFACEACEFVLLEKPPAWRRSEGSFSVEARGGCCRLYTTGGTLHSTGLL